MREWDVPGCCVGVVKGSRQVHAGAYGVRDIEHGKPVTQDTLFYTASFGKTFTATLIASLVDDGVLDWDRPVRDYLPWFRMHDELATRRATLRDFLSHRTGLGRHTRLWVHATLSRPDVLKRLRHLQPKRDFRCALEYSNVNYIVAGAVAELVTGRTWEDLVRTRVLDPLGMTATRFVTDDLPADADVATGYERTATGNQPFRRDFRKTWSLAATNGPCAPAGALLSDVRDMGRYLQLHVRGGMAGTRQIASHRNLAQTHTPHVVWPGLSRLPELPDALYGMGWIVQPYRGYPCVYCGGNAYGFGMVGAFLPSESLSVVVMANQAATPMVNIIARNAFDRMLGLSQVPWNRRSLRLKRRRATAPARASKPARTRPPRPLHDYAGRYTHPAYGTLDITLHGGQLHLVHNQFPFRVAHRHGDVFSISLPTDYEKQASFGVDDTGKVVSVAVPFAPGVDPIAFRPVVPRKGRTTRRSPRQRGHAKSP